MSIGTRLFTFLHGSPIGRDATGNRYFQDKRLPKRGLRRRRWVLFARGEEATDVPAEWQAWLRYTTDAPIADEKRHAWQKPHLPNQTGTVLSYRPPGHDYQGGHRAAATGDYESWTPGS